MPQREVIEFTSYEFTAEEYPLAVCFSELQLKHIHTLLAKYAQQKVNASSEDFTTAEFYIRAQEYLRGLMSGMSYLLEVHRTYREEFAELVEEQMRRQAEDSGKGFGTSVSTSDSIENR
jgi:hypothetical protein